MGKLNVLITLTGILYLNFNQIHCKLITFDGVFSFVPLIMVSNMAIDALLVV